MDTAVTLPFADGEYRFWLPLPQLFELERAADDTSILTIEERLRTACGVGEDGEYVFVGGGSAMARDITNTIRCGLIGGNSGMVDGEEVEVGPILAKRLVEAYAYPARPMSESALLAWRILHAAIFGVQTKPDKKKDEVSA